MFGDQNILPVSCFLLLILCIGVVECLKKKQSVDEQPHEVPGTTANPASNGPTKGRENVLNQVSYHSLDISKKCETLGVKWILH